MHENVRSQLITLISGLYFMSESEYPFTIEELHENNFSQIEKNILSKYEPQLKLKRFETSDFFNRIINNFEISEDELSQSFARKYKELYQFIIQSCKSSIVVNCGKIEVGVFIIMEFKNESFAVLKTISVET
jgi:DNA modification methylase